MLTVDIHLVKTHIKALQDFQKVCASSSSSGSKKVVFSPQKSKRQGTEDEYKMKL